MSREHAIARKLCALYSSDRWAFLRQVRTATGAHREGERIADVVAVALWPSMGPRVHVIEIKDDPHDFGREIHQSEKSEPFVPYASARLFAVMAPWQRTVRSTSLLPPGWGLVSCGTGKPTIVVPPDERPPAIPFDPFVLSLLRAAARPIENSGAPTIAPLRKILPRRMLKPVGSPVTKLAVALDVIEEASLDQLGALEAALAARRAA